MKALDLAQAYLRHARKAGTDDYESNDAFLAAEQELKQLATDIASDPLDDEFVSIADELESARAEIEELKKKVSNAEASIKYWADQTANANRELESIHRILDRVDNPPKRDDSDKFPEGTDDWKFSKYTTVERLSVWLSKR